MGNLIARNSHSEEMKKDTYNQKEEITDNGKFLVMNFTRTELPKHIGSEDNQENLIKLSLYSQIEEIEIMKSKFLFPGANQYLINLNKAKENEMILYSLLPVMFTFTYRYLTLSKNCPKYLKTKPVQFHILFSTACSVTAFLIINRVYKSRFYSYVDFLNNDLFKNDISEEKDFTKLYREYYEFKIKFKKYSYI